jgi:hypothetical protein
MIVAHVEKSFDNKTLRFCIDAIDLHDADTRIREMNCNDQSATFRLVGVETSEGLLKKVSNIKN